MKNGDRGLMTGAAPRFLLDHIGIAVPRLEEAMDMFRRLFGSPITTPEEVASEKVRIAFLEAGRTRIELLEATSPESAVSKFLAGGRSGIHHLSFRVEGMAIGAWFDELQRRGVEVLGNGPHPGGGGSRVFFVHPRSAAGTLIEFSQADPSDGPARTDPARTDKER